MTEQRRNYLKNYYRKKRSEHPEQFICYWLNYVQKKGKEWKTTDKERYTAVYEKIRAVEQELNK